MQDVKTGAKIATKEAAKKVTRVKDAKRKVKKQPNVLRFMMDTKLPIKMQRDVKKAHPMPDYLKLLAARAAEITGCSLYFRKKCDYILPDSITKGSAAAVSSHKNELTNKIKAFSKCAKHAVKAGLQQPPTTPSNMTTIPTKKDINPTPGNLDELTALKHFHGKSQSEAANLFFECPTYYEEDLKWMGSKAFAFYFFLLWNRIFCRKQVKMIQI